MIKNKIKTYQGHDFVIQIPDFWEIEHPNNNTTVFNGPSIGENKANLIISASKSTKGAHLAICRRSKIIKSRKSNYKCIREEDISTRALAILMRISKWEKPNLNLMVYNREFIISTKEKNYVVQSFIPVSPDLVVLDRVFLKFMQTFKFGRLKIKQ